jgi:hypothetical protein
LQSAEYRRPTRKGEAAAPVVRAGRQQVVRRGQLLQVAVVAVVVAEDVAPLRRRLPRRPVRRT